MQSLLKRLEALEAANPSPSDRQRVALHFVAAKDGKPLGAMLERAWSGGKAIIRSPNETAEAFEERAFDHFAEIDAAPWPLLVLFN
jgi:hypothetical protein